MRTLLYAIGSVASAVYVVVFVLAAQAIPFARFAACVAIAGLLIWFVASGRSP